MMKRQLAAVVVGGLAVALLVAGCGSSSSASDEPLTKAQYVKKANAVCTTYGKRVFAEVGAYLKKHPARKTPSEAQSSGVMGSVVLPGLASEVEALKALPAPRGDGAQIEAMLAKLEAGLAEGETDPTHFFSSQKSEFSRGVKLAQAYGLKGCGTLIL
jgi:hypothetical protein